MAVHASVIFFADSGSYCTGNPPLAAPGRPTSRWNFGLSLSAGARRTREGRNALSLNASTTSDHWIGFGGGRGGGSEPTGSADWEDDERNRSYFC